MKSVIITKENVIELADDGTYIVVDGEHTNVTVNEGVTCNVIHHKGSKGNQIHYGDWYQVHYGEGDQVHYGDGSQFHYGQGGQVHRGEGDQFHHGK